MILSEFLRRARPRAAAGVVLALAGTAVAGAVPAVAADASSIDGCFANPMGVATPVGAEHGYTLFTTGDAVLANSELEGTLAVGGVATFGDPRGVASAQYPIFHGGVGGNADYGVPVIDGEPNRVLIGAFAGTKIVQVKVQPAGSPDAGVKIVDRTQPAGYVFGPQFGGSGTTFFPAGGGNQDPQIESQARAWDGGAGAASFAASHSTVSGYFPDDRGSALLEQVGIWKTPTIVPGGETSVTLDPTGPNLVTLSELMGDTPWPAAKFTISGYSTTAPLVIRVSTSDVVDGRLTLPSYAGAGKDAVHAPAISHILWDLSALDGTVEVTSLNEPVRGSFYAPLAHIVFPAEADGGKEFEGQLVSRSLTALQGGKELHTNLFAALLPCADDSAENPGGENPGEENPGGETPGGDDPGAENPGGETPGGDDPGAENPGGENPGDEPSSGLPLTEDASQDEVALPATGGASPLPLLLGGAAALAAGVAIAAAARVRRSTGD